jgi:general secretion pathway protein K
MKILNNMIKTQKGFALLLVMWVLTILMVIVLSFSSMARVETFSAMSFKEMTEKKFIAEAGIERGILELFYAINKDTKDIPQKDSIIIDESDVWKTDGSAYRDKMGDGDYSVTIVDEGGKIDINTAPDIVLRNLFKSIGVQDEDVDAIVDSIMDWKDPDDLRRLSGVESDYYMSLPTPYKAKNANFDTVEELILVKGISPDILFGTDKKRGIIDYLTVHSKQRRINVNAAPKEVLMAIPNMTSEIADAIIDYRKDKKINHINEIHGIIGQSFTAMMPYISAGRSNIFTIESVGYKAGGKSGYSIKATVIIEGNKKYKCVYYKNPA